MFASRARAFAFVLPAFLLACGDAPWVGTYETKADVNIVGPLADGRTIGDAAADFFLTEAVNISSLPAKDTVIELLTTLFHDRLKQNFERLLPEGWGPEGEYTKLLRSSLANVRFESELALEEGGAFQADVQGTETFTAVELLDLPNRPRMDLKARGLTSTWEGEDQDDHLVIEPHPMALSYAELVVYVAGIVLGRDVMADLDKALADALDCGPLVKDLLGGKEGFDIDLGLTSVNIDAEFLSNACTSVRKKIVESAYSVVFEGPITLGGTVTLSTDDPTRALVSRPETYGGTFRVLPDSIAPKIRASLQATRK